MNKERGGILIMVLMVLFILLLFSLTFYYLTTSQIIQSAHQEELNRVKIGAESAVASALWNYRQNIQNNLVDYIVTWNTNNPGDAIFPNPANQPDTFVARYVEFVNTCFDGMGDPMNQPVRISAEGFDEMSVTDLDTYLVIGNSPVLINDEDTVLPAIADKWPAFDNDFDFGLPGRVKFKDGEGFTFEVNIPYRIITMAGTEESDGRYTSQYNVIEQGYLLQPVNNRILNLWVLCTEKQRNRNYDSPNWVNAIWFTGSTKFKGPVHTNDHYNIANSGGKPKFTHTLKSANKFGNSYFGNTYKNSIPQGYMPYSFYSGNANKSYSSILPNLTQYYFSDQAGSHQPIVRGNPDGYGDRPVAYADSVDFPENSIDQKLKSMHSKATSWSSAWDSLTQTTVNNNAGKIVGGIYVPGNADYVHFSIVSTRPEHSGILAPWKDTDNNDLPSSPIHSAGSVNTSDTIKLDNGFQMVKVLYNGTVTEVLIQDDDYVLGGIAYKQKKTYVRSYSGSSGPSGARWTVYDGIPNGMLYVNGNLGYASSTGKGPGLSGVVSGNLKPREDTQGNIYYTSDTQWNVTALSDIYLDGNVLYSCYGQPDPVSFYEGPDDGLNSAGSIYRYGYTPDADGFYNFNTTLFSQSGDGSFIHQNMMGIFTASGNILYNPNNMTGSLKEFYVDAFIMASTGMIEVYNYSDSHWGGSATGNGPVRLRGGYIERLYGAHGTFGSNNSGFNRNFTWDKRGAQIAPPFWPKEERYAEPSNPPYVDKTRRRAIRSNVINWPPSDQELITLMNTNISELY